MTTLPMIAADHIRALIDPITTTERIDRFVPVPNITEPPWHLHGWTKTREPHTITHPSLIEQLRQSTSQSKDGEFAGGSAKSKPAARLEALDVLAKIERESRTLARELDVDRPHLYNRLSAIGGAIGNDTHPVVRAWWIAARCTTGWEQPPYAPDVPCPNMECERRASLRVRIADEIATCVKCGTTWGADSFVTLGDYIRWASEHLSGKEHTIYDGDGYPSKCIECEMERDAMAERKAARKTDAKRPDVA